jgi:hypothetical protein
LRQAGGSDQFVDRFKLFTLYSFLATFSITCTAQAHGVSVAAAKKS